MISEGDWDYDETVIKNLGQRQLKNYAQFIEQYEDDLKNVSEISTLDRLWDFTLNPISLQMAPYEKLDLVDLIRTDNRGLNKVMIVLSSSPIPLVRFPKLVQYAPSGGYLSPILFAYQ